MRARTFLLCVMLFGLVCLFAISDPATTSATGEACEVSLTANSPPIDGADILGFDPRIPETFELRRAWVSTPARRYDFENVTNRPVKARSRDDPAKVNTGRLNPYNSKSAIRLRV